MHHPSLARGIDHRAGAGNRVRPLLMLASGGGAWRDEVNGALAPLSWDATFARMAELVDEAVHAAPTTVAERRAP